MTLGLLWYPVLKPAPVPTLRAANHIFNRGQPFAHTLPVATNAADCIILSVWADGATAAPTGSGAGATWLSFAQPSHQFALLVGYNCAAGQTTCTVTAPGGSGTPVVPGLNIDCSVWQGVSTASPVIGSPDLSQMSTTTTITSGSVPYLSNNLILGAAAINNPIASSLSPSFSSGATPLRTNPTGAQYVVADYFVAGSGGSTTLTETDVTTGTMSIVLAVLAAL